MFGFRFHDPLWLVLLLPLAATAWWYRRRRPAAAIYSNIDILKTLGHTTAQRVRRLLPWLGWIALAMLIVALARPQRGKEEYRVRAEGIAIEMVIDRSGSMHAMDFKLDGKQVERIDVVKKTFRQFVDGDPSEGLGGRPDDLVGLVDFGGYVETKCPLTLDHAALGQLLDTVQIADTKRGPQGQSLDSRFTIPDCATAIGDALATAVDRLKPVKAKSKIVILLSDGVSNAGALRPEEAAEIAKTFGIKVYTIGIGTHGNGPMVVPGPFGNQLVQVEFDEEAMRRIAETTGGRYFSANDTESLKSVYAEINKLERTVSEGRVYTQYREFYEYALFPGLALLLAQIGLVSTRFRTLP
jgi:Ca-activated chloride channel homolog